MEKLTKSNLWGRVTLNESDVGDLEGFLSELTNREQVSLLINLAERSLSVPNSHSRDALISKLSKIIVNKLSLIETRI